MATDLSVKSQLLNVAKNLKPKATLEDVMYELYVRMKVAKGRLDIKRSKLVSHEDVKKRYA